MTAAADVLLGVHDLDRCRAFVWIHRDHDKAQLRPPLLDPQPLVELGGQRCFEQCKPLLSLSLPWRPDPRRPNESHTTKRGQPR